MGPWEDQADTSPEVRERALPPIPRHAQHRNHTFPPSNPPPFPPALVAPHVKPDPRPVPPHSTDVRPDSAAPRIDSPAATATRGRSPGPLDPASTRRRRLPGPIGPLDTRPSGPPDGHCALCPIALGRAGVSPAQGSTWCGMTGRRLGHLSHRPREGRNALVLPAPFPSDAPE